MQILMSCRQTNESCRNLPSVRARNARKDVTGKCFIVISKWIALKCVFLKLIFLGGGHFEIIVELFEELFNIKTILRRWRVLVVLNHYFGIKCNVQISTGIISLDHGTDLFLSLFQTYLYFKPYFILNKWNVLPYVYLFSFCFFCLFFYLFFAVCKLQCIKHFHVFCSG